MVVRKLKRVERKRLPVIGFPTDKETIHDSRLILYSSPVLESFRPRVRTEVVIVETLGLLSWNEDQEEDVLFSVFGQLGPSRDTSDSCFETDTGVPRLESPKMVGERTGGALHAIRFLVCSITLP